MISLLVFDIDGTLTDGRLHYNEDGDESKTFSVKDGLAISTWNKIEGKSSAFITGRTSKIVERRAKELGVKFLYQGISDKKAVLLQIMQELRVDFAEVAIIGDDLNDFSMLASLANTFCPRDASFHIQNIVDVVLEEEGGRGAGREMIEYILKRDPHTLKQFLAFYQ